MARPKIDTDDLDPAAIEIELLDDAVEARERAVEHLDLVADLVIDLDLGLRRGGGGFVLGVEDARGLGLADRLRLAHRAEEARHLRRVLHEVIDVVVHLELGQHIAGEELAFRRAPSCRGGPRSPSRSAPRPARRAGRDPCGSPPP